MLMAAGIWMTPLVLISAISAQKRQGMLLNQSQDLEKSAASTRITK
jgi:hypothetical protein